jgi:hypothetical protein
MIAGNLPIQMIQARAETAPGDRPFGTLALHGVPLNVIV